MSANTVGGRTKRPRDHGDDDSDEEGDRSRVRTRPRTETEIGEGESNFDNCDDFDPPTPPIPRPLLVIKTEVSSPSPSYEDEDFQAVSPSGSSGSHQGECGSEEEEVIVKSEPTDTESEPLESELLNEENSADINEDDDSDGCSSPSSGFASISAEVMESSASANTNGTEAGSDDDEAPESEANDAEAGSDEVPESEPNNTETVTSSDQNGSEARSDEVPESEPNNSETVTSTSQEKVTEKGRPSTSSFFEFTTAEVVHSRQPNVMTTEIEVVPMEYPERTHYNAHPSEEELAYNNDTSEDRIPIFSKDKRRKRNADCNNSEEEEGGEGDVITHHGEKLTRYFQRNVVYEKYDFDNRKVDTTKLAVYEKRAHILNILGNNRVLIVEGFTGCGKTTQIPQYIMDKCFEDKKFCNIVVTQPRKIAAISVAKRVCFERNWQLGSVVGYQVGMEAKKDKNDTLLTFMTTGVLLQKLISEKSLKEFTHIIIDEVHERDLESDFLLLVIKKLMKADVNGNESHVKLILMSATIDTNKFENYFKFETENGDVLTPPVVKIPFVPLYRVEEFYLNDLLVDNEEILNTIQSNLQQEKAMISEDVYDIAVNCIKSLDDKETEANPDPRLRGRGELPNSRGAVLVFLPGMEEIKTLERALEKNKSTKPVTITTPENRREVRMKDYKWVVYPLHSSVTAEDQARVFESPGDKFRKIILSTNIAESSVTVPDIAYVIDFCLTKSLCVDETTNFTTLKMVWASKSQCIQRKGRAGRVSHGKVYRLLPRNFYTDYLGQNIIPEMKRSNLDLVILMCKKFDFGAPIELLRDALDRPALNGIERAVATLKEFGALTITKKNIYGDGCVYETCDGDLTFIGKVMSALPIPLQCTRLILFGHCFGVMREAVIIAAGLSVKSPFQTGFRKQLNTYLEKMKHAKRSFSDLFALHHVYKFWINTYCENAAGDVTRNNEYNWAKGAMVHLSVLREIKATVELLEERLKRLGIEDSYVLQPDQNHVNSWELSSEQGMFLKLAIAGAFYPNYFLRRRPDARQFERDVNREANGNDVFRTVYFKGFPKGHEGKLYAKHVADYLGCGSNIPTINFDGQKVFAVFDNSIGDTIGPFSTGIFRAVKLRQLRMESLEFRTLWKEHERRAVNQWENHVRQRRCTPCPTLRPLPPIEVNSVQVKVQHILSPTRFWVVLSRDFLQQETIYDTIQKNFIHIPMSESKLCPNCLCLAPFENIYCRVKVLRTKFPDQSLVYFIDYGNCEWVPNADLSDFSPYMVEQGITKVKSLAIECRLQGVKPNIVHGLHWSEESVCVMKNFCYKAPFLELKIFSIYQNIMVGELIGYMDAIAKTQECSLKEMLITPNEIGKLYGEYAPEPYMSIENNRKRERARFMEDQERKAASEEQRGDILNLDFIEPPALRHNQGSPVTLKGPWSPLEMRFQALVQCSVTKEVRIDNSSVNSVLLDHEPTAPNSRMLVASHCGVADKSQAVMIRDSTVMSAIPGILQLVCLMFAPKVELRVDRNVSKYAGVLCGCGTVSVGANGGPEEFKTVHPDDDMEIVFDTEIDDDDIEKVNFIRYYMNNILRQVRGTVAKAESHKRLREHVIKLLRRQRKKIDEEIWQQEEYLWNRLDKDMIDAEGPVGLVFQHYDIFQPHSKVKLNRMEVEEVVWDGGY